MTSNHWLLIIIVVILAAAAHKLGSFDRCVKLGYSAMDCLMQHGKQQ
jgi:hypothetical protein